MYPQFSTNTTYPYRPALSTIASEDATDRDKSVIFSTQQTTKRGTIGAINDSIGLQNMLKRPQSGYASNRPGTGTTSYRRPTTAGTNSRPPKRIMAIAEGRGVAAEVGICVFDINSCEIELSQMADSQSFSRTLQSVNLNEPQKILMPPYAETSALSGSSRASKLSVLLQQHYPHIPIITLPRKCFNDEKGKQYIVDFCMQEDVAGLLFGVSTKYFCLAAFAGAFQHVFETEGCSFANHNTITAKNLELVHNTAHTHSKQNTLLGILDYTLTPMGKRLLRTNILQPPCSLEITNDRLDTIEELCQNEECIYNIQSSLRQLVDIDSIISFIVKIPVTHPEQNSVFAVQYSEQKINHVVHLKQVIKSIKAIAQSLPEHVKNPLSRYRQVQPSCKLLHTIYNILSNQVFDELEVAINNIINEDIGIEKSSLGIRNQKCYAVKSGVNGLLDVARQTYKETTEDIYELITNYGEAYKLKIKLEYTASRGYSISMPINQLTNGAQLPNVFINVIQKKKTIQFTTLELLQKNNRLNESMTEVFLMSEKTVTQLLEIFRNHINALYKASEAIALLDFLTSLATYNLNSTNLVRPEFSNTLAIKSGRHPILECILLVPVVPNDTFTSLSSSFQFVTGPNMSGKSTYLKQVALLVIMAQIGSFVPADYASFRLCDQMLSRLANENTFSDIGTSSFMSEMREIAYLLQHVTNDSIVLVDELGRGTSPEDALGISGAVCEDLARTRAFCFFATHLHELTCTMDIYPNVVNLQFKVNVTKTNERDCTVDFQYKIEDGRLATENHYGLQTAQILGLPAEVLNCAYKVVTDLEGNRRNLLLRQTSQQHNLTRERKLLWFADKMLQLGQVSSTASSTEQLQSELEKLQDSMRRGTFY
ncbi:muts domain V-domain-containing protein [Mucor lusitanicus]|uniref:DNA mismatch repair protein MSH3 n=1 Tax=Mucor circinelloides f. lusitanicus TaxID=29924 RepID=A0A8H4F1J5_MUCCL|nr:muts domain V-domain-containing protein [Mucor lusitanicus]